MNTYSAKETEVVRKWHSINLDGQVLGRAATRIANILRGKHKPQYTPHVDTGDFVLALNASKVKLTGKKLEQKEYHNHSGYYGGMKTLTAKKLLEKKPQEIIYQAVLGMLPKNALGKQMIKKLKIYSGANHPHVAQKPQDLQLSK